MAKAKRKYDNTYLNYGFMLVERGDEQLPQCFACLKTFSNSMKPHQKKQYLSKVHSQFDDKNRNFFELKATGLKKMKLNHARQLQTVSKAILTLSYEISLQVAKAKKVHHRGEMLIKSCLVACAGILLGDCAVPKMHVLLVGSGRHFQD